MKKLIKKMAEEFKTFISRGNVLDLAVGVIVGGAFSKIVSSLVQDVLMPIIGIISGGLDFSNLTINIGDASIKYGLFIQNIIDFLTISFVIFIIIKLINKLTHKEEKERLEKEKQAKQTPIKSDEVLLLEEIRDLLKKSDKKKK